MDYFLFKTTEFQINRFWGGKWEKRLKMRCNRISMELSDIAEWRRQKTMSLRLGHKMVDNLIGRNSQEPTAISQFLCALKWSMYFTNCTTDFGLRSFYDWNARIQCESMCSFEIRFKMIVLFTIRVKEMHFSVDLWRVNVIRCGCLVKFPNENWHLQVRKKCNVEKNCVPFVEHFFSLFFYTKCTLSLYAR